MHQIRRLRALRNSLPTSAPCSTRAMTERSGCPLRFFADEVRGVISASVFRPVNRAGKAQDAGLSEKVVWQLLLPYAETAGLGGIAPHDLRRYAESRTMPHVLNSGPSAAWAEQTDSA
jgi:hypothetical protein